MTQPRATLHHKELAAMQFQGFLDAIGQEVEDVEEECFELFSRDIPSANLGFVDSRATTIDVTIHGHDFSVHQSPTLLSSTRAGGTTGAVLWKITPLFAEWISDTTNNPIWTSSILHPTSTAVELGCGISGLVALALAPSLDHYIATDQEYVHRLLRANLDENTAAAYRSHHGPGRPQQQKKQRGRKAPASKHGDSSSGSSSGGPPNITFTSLDWELDAPSTLKETIKARRQTSSLSSETDDSDADLGFDLLISCDCIYNEALVAPFVRTCADICRLRPAYEPDPDRTSSSSRSEERRRQPTVCAIAQQQRSPDVFEAWLREAMRQFRVWRVSDEVLGSTLKSGTGYVVHVLVLRGDE